MLLFINMSLLLVPNFSTEVLVQFINGRCLYTLCKALVMCLHLIKVRVNNLITPATNLAQMVTLSTKLCLILSVYCRIGMDYVEDKL